MPKNIEKPRTNKFLAEFRSIYWSVERPTAVIIPNTTKNNPPIIGSGMVMNMAPTFPISPQTIMIIPLYCTTLTLPT